MLDRLKEKGITIFVSTPYMDEASLCDRIALIQEGSIFSVDTPEKLLSDFNETIYGIKGQDMYRLLLDLESYEGIKSAHAFGEYHHALFSDNSIDIENVIRELESKGHQEVIIEKISPTIEDLFLDFMGKKVPV